VDAADIPAYKYCNTLNPQKVGLNFFKSYFKKFDDFFPNLVNRITFKIDVCKSVYLWMMIGSYWGYY